MQARQLSAREGGRWLAGGLAVFLKNPPLLTLIILAYWLIIALVNSLPVLGPIAATLSIPAFSVGLMNACRKLDAGEPLEIQVLFSGFRQQPKSLLTLGGLYLAVSAVALGASAIADGGIFVQTMVGGYHPSPEELGSNAFLAAALIALTLMAPVIMAWWYAPILVAWHDMPPAKSLFFSFIACLRNWQAFIAYTGAILLFGGLIPGIALGLLVSVLPAAASVVTTLFTLPLIFVLAPTLIASFYVSYREVFTTGEANTDGTDAHDRGNAEDNATPRDDA